ncbi:hypothetical protein ACU4GR_27580 [Methylobacterium oryzae CBMB20]
MIPQICAPELMAAAEAALDGAFRATFVPDPLLGPGLSQLGSVLASMVKRHGGLIEAAITDVLERSGRYIVLRNVAMPITVPTQELVRASSVAQLNQTSIELAGAVAQSVFLDLIVVDRKRVEPSSPRSKEAPEKTRPGKFTKLNGCCGARRSRAARF